MTSRLVVNNSATGANQYLEIRPYSRLYCGYSANTTNGLGTQNQWERFPYPSSGYTVYRNQDFTVDNALSKFTYVGSTPRWFDISATCNVVKGSGAVNQARTLKVQWRMNGNPIGSEREFQMNTDSSIIAGNGQVYLSNGDYLEPWFINIENNDQARLSNCSFNFLNR